MRHLAIFLVAGIALVAASPLEVERLRESIILNEENTRNSALEQLILGLLEEIRELMVTGSDIIPVLEPLTIDSFHIDQNTIAIIPGHVTINDLAVNGLSTFEINEFGIAMTSLLQQRFRITLDASIPVIDIMLGGYDLNLNVFGGTIFGTGDATLKIVQPRLRANVVLAIRLSGGIFISLEECELAVSLEAFEPRITGLFNDPDISEFISVFLKNLVEEILQFFEEEINEFISLTVFDLGNELLANLDLSGILGV